MLEGTPSKSDSHQRPVAHSTERKVAVPHVLVLLFFTSLCGLWVGRTYLADNDAPPRDGESFMAGWGTPSREAPPTGVITYRSLNKRYILVTLSTIPARMPSLNNTLQSLLAQVLFGCYACAF